MAIVPESFPFWVPTFQGSLHLAGTEIRHTPEVYWASTKCCERLLKEIDSCGGDS
jgi:hypothetical protein